MSEWTSVASPLFVQGLPGSIFPFAKPVHCFSRRAEIRYNVSFVSVIEN